jgi:hypothetical protein
MSKHSRCHHRAQTQRWTRRRLRRNLDRDSGFLGGDYARGTFDLSPITLPRPWRYERLDQQPRIVVGHRPFAQLSGAASASGSFVRASPCERRPAPQELLVAYARLNGELDDVRNELIKHGQHGPLFSVPVDRLGVMSVQLRAHLTRTASRSARLEQLDRHGVYGRVSDEPQWELPASHPSHRARQKRVWRAQAFDDLH